MINFSFLITEAPNLTSNINSPLKQTVAAIAKAIPVQSNDENLYQTDDGLTPEERLNLHVGSDYINPNNYKSYDEFIKAVKDDTDTTNRTWAQATKGTGGDIGSGFTSWIPGTDNSRLENRLDHNKALLDRYEGKKDQFNYEFLNGKKPDDPSFWQQHGTTIGALGGAALLGAGMYYGYKKYKDFKKRKEQERIFNGAYANY